MTSSNKAPFLKYYKKFVTNGDLTAIENLFYSTILSYINKMENKYIDSKLSIFKRINTTINHKNRVLKRLEAKGYIRLNNRRRGSSELKITALRQTPKVNNGNAWIPIAWDEIEASKDYTLLIIRKELTRIFKRNGCVDYQHFVKSGLFNHMTIRNKLKELETITPIDIDGRKYLILKGLLASIQQTKSDEDYEWINEDEYIGKSPQEIMSKTDLKGEGAPYIVLRALYNTGRLITNNGDQQ